MASKYALPALALLMFAGATFAAFSEFEDKFGGMFRDQMSNWQGMAIVAISICFFFNLLVYMAGRGLQSEHLKRYAQSEFLQVTASALLIAFGVQLLYTMSTGNGLGFMRDVIGENSRVACGAPEIPGGSFQIWNEYPPYGTGPLGAFRCKLQEKITALDSAYDAVYKQNAGNERWSSTCINLFGFPVYCGDWDLAVHKDMEKAHLINTKIVSLLIPLHGLYSLATYIENNMLSVFLPAGLVLRIFPLTRGVGGLFIAIAIGFFFVWPTFFVLSDPTFVKVDANEAPNQERTEGACFTGFKGTAVVVQGIIDQRSVGGMAGEALAGMDDAKLLLFQLTISVMFYPFVAFALTLVFVRAMTPLLGGDMGDFMKMVGRLG